MKDIRIQQHTGGYLLIWNDHEGIPPVGGFKPETEICKAPEDAKARLEELMDEVFG